MLNACAADPASPPKKYTALDEDCDARGDEDQNGVADCGDPACAGRIACLGGFTLSTSQRSARMT
jgi:hypothetical protein